MSKAVVPRKDLSHNLGTRVKRWGTVYAGIIEASKAAGGLQADIDSRATKDELTSNVNALQADIDSRATKSEVKNLIPIASNSVLGGIKVGNGLSIDAAGILSALNVGTDLTFIDRWDNTNGAGSYTWVFKFGEGHRIARQWLMLGKAVYDHNPDDHSNSLATFYLPYSILNPIGLITPFNMVGESEYAYRTAWGVINPNGGSPTTYLQVMFGSEQPVRGGYSFLVCGGGPA